MSPTAQTYHSVSARDSASRCVEGNPATVNVVHLNSHVPWRGGEQQVLYLTRGLHTRGHHSVVICPPHSTLYHRSQEAGLPAEAMRMRHELDLVAAWYLGRYLRQQRVEILHMHTPHAHMIGLLASKLAPQVRLVVSRRSDFAPSSSDFIASKTRSRGLVC